MSNVNLSDKVVIGTESLTEVQPPQKIKVTLDDEVIEIEAKEDMPILEQLIEAGYNPPYSCMSGSCMACMAKLKSGTIYQNEAGILSDDNIQNLEVLTCQAKTVSSDVEIDYDDL